MITLILFLTALLIGLPIFIALLIGAFSFLYSADLGLLMSSVPLQIYGAIEQNGLLAIPLFMLVGELMNRGGLTIRLMRAADVMVGGIRGGLAYVNLMTNAMSASILGSAIAQISVMSRTMIPAMEEKGYTREFSAAVTISGGLLGPIIPPSMLMIIYGVIAYQPISDLFIAGIIPGILIVMGFALVIMLVGIIKGLPGKQKNEIEHQSYQKDLIGGFLPGVIPFAVIAGIMSGVMTPTEAGALASALAFILGGLIYRNVKWTELPEILVKVGVNTANITILIACATLFGWVLSFESVPDMMVDYLSSLTTNPIVFLLLVNLIVIFLGMFLESISVMIVIVPILLPVSIALGVDPIHFGVVISLATLIGLVTPPVGPGLFIATTCCNISMGALFRAFIPFLISMLLCMTLISVFPQISLWLPSLFK